MDKELSEIEKEMLEKMAAQEGQVCTDEDLRPATDNIKNEQQKEMELPTLSKHVLPLLFDQLIGIKFKFGEAYFQINFTNVGKKRFSAELLNPVAEVNTDK